MNKQRRNELNDIIERLEGLMADVEALRDEEQDCYDNMPENLQYSERGEMAENAISEMDNAISSIEDAISSLETASE